MELSLVFPSGINNFIQIIQETKPTVKESVFFRHDYGHSTILLIKCFSFTSLAAVRERFTKQKRNHRMFE